MIQCPSGGPVETPLVVAKILLYESNCGIFLNRLNKRDGNLLCQKAAKVQRKTHTLHFKKHKNEKESLAA